MWTWRRAEGKNGSKKTNRNRLVVGKSSYAVFFYPVKHHGHILSARFVFLFLFIFIYSCQLITRVRCMNEPLRMSIIFLLLFSLFTACGETSSGATGPSWINSCLSSLKTAESAPHDLEYFGGWCKAELPAWAVGLLKYHCWPSKAFPDASGVSEHYLLPELTPGGLWRRNQSDWSNCCSVAVVSDHVEGVTSPAAPPHRGRGMFPILWQKTDPSEEII